MGYGRHSDFGRGDFGRWTVAGWFPAVQGGEQAAHPESPGGFVKTSFRAAEQAAPFLMNWPGRRLVSAGRCRASWIENMETCGETCVKIPGANPMRNTTPETKTLARTGLGFCTAQFRVPRGRIFTSPTVFYEDPDHTIHVSGAPPARRRKRGCDGA